MADCIDDLRSIGITCAAQNQAGGANKRVWLTQKQQIEAYTKDANGYVDSITMGAGASADYELITVTGKQYKNSGAFEAVIGDNVNLIKHTVVVKIYPETPTQNENILTLVNSDEMVALLETENGSIVVYGLDKGMKTSALTGGTGTALQDDTSVTLTLAGDQRRLPEYFLVTDLETSIAYLDAISAPVV